MNELLIRQVSALFAAVFALLAVAGGILFIIERNLAWLPTTLVTASLAASSAYLAGVVRWPRFVLGIGIAIGLAGAAIAGYGIATGANWSVLGVDVRWDGVLGILSVVAALSLWWHHERQHANGAARKRAPRRR